MFYIFGGLPGTGKSVLSKYLSEVTGATYLRIDTIEQSLRDNGITNIYDRGYKVAAAVALENLKLGHSVITDSTNPVADSRELWRNVANQAQVQFCEIEIICSDKHEHEQRIINRISDIPTLQQPSWESVLNREYHPWNTERIVLDTTKRTITQSKRDMLDALGMSS